MFYKRYFIVSNRQSFIQIQEQPVTKKFKRIFNLDLIAVTNLQSNNDTLPETVLPWKYSFELETKGRSYVLYAPTLEERDLWVNGIRRLINLPVKDPCFRPMQMVSKASLHMTK